MLAVADAGRGQNGYSNIHQVAPHSHSRSLENKAVIAPVS